MTIDDLLKKCEDAYGERDFERLAELCDEVLKKDRDNQLAIAYKSISHCFSHRSEKALECRLDKDEYGGYSHFIDQIKEAIHENDLEIPAELDDYYKAWIYKIRYNHNTGICPDCGGELIPIVYGYLNRKTLEKSLRGELALGGCNPLPYDHECRKCNHRFMLGKDGLKIDCDNVWLDRYIRFKIDEVTFGLKRESMTFTRFCDGLMEEVNGFDDEEFDAFIGHLVEIGYLSRPRDGCIRIVGFDELKCMKEYLDDGKFVAPRWLAFPNLSAGSMYWRMGFGENYAMNMPWETPEFEELFSKPRSWQFYFERLRDCPAPPIGFLWSDDGKPKYPKSLEGVEVNGFITPDDEGKFEADTFNFTSISHAMSLSKRLYIKRYSGNEVVKGCDAEEIWEAYRYTVLLNACYFKVMQDEELKRRLLETGDEPLVYVSDDDENLFGRALMELRDEIRRICKNEDLIDWEFSEYLKQMPWM